MSTAGLSLPCLIPSHGYPQMKIELSLTFQALPKLATAWTLSTIRHRVFQTQQSWEGSESSLHSAGEETDTSTSCRWGKLRLQRGPDFPSVTWQVLGMAVTRHSHAILDVRAGSPCPLYQRGLQGPQAGQGLPRWALQYSEARMREWAMFPQRHQPLLGLFPGVGTVALKEGLAHSGC